MAVKMPLFARRLLKGVDESSGLLLVEGVARALDQASDEGGVEQLRMIPPQRSVDLLRRLVAPSNDHIPEINPAPLSPLSSVFDEMDRRDDDRGGGQQVEEHEGRVKGLALQEQNGTLSFVCNVRPEIVIPVRLQSPRKGRQGRRREWRRSEVRYT